MVNEYNSNKMKLNILYSRIELPFPEKLIKKRMVNEYDSQ